MVVAVVAVAAVLDDPGGALQRGAFGDAEDGLAVPDDAELEVLAGVGVLRVDHEAGVRHGLVLLW